MSAKGTAAWILRYAIAGKPKELTLGRYPDIPLTKAREIAAANAWTFRKLADDYFEKAGDWLADNTIKGRKQQLRDYVYPKIGSIAAEDVSPVEIVAIVEAASVKSLHIARLALIAIREVAAIELLRDDPAFADEYLQAAMEQADEEGGREALLSALRHVAEAQGMAQVAERAGIQRESLYRALSPKGNPTLKTLVAVLEAAGLRLAITRRDEAHA